MTRYRAIGAKAMAVLLTIAAAVTSVHAAASATTNELSSQVAAILPLCASCHGVDGISGVGLYPNLAGQKPEYLAKQLHDFKAGRREDAVMRPMAEPLDDAAIEALSQHFGKMPGAR